MPGPKLLIEQWLPIEAIGAECMRDAGCVVEAAAALIACMFGGHVVR